MLSGSLETEKGYRLNVPNARMLRYTRRVWVTNYRRYAPSVYLLTLSNYCHKAGAFNYLSHAVIVVSMDR